MASEGSLYRYHLQHCGRHQLKTCLNTISNNHYWSHDFLSSTWYSVCSDFKALMDYLYIKRAILFSWCWFTYNGRRCDSCKLGDFQHASSKTKVKKTLQREGFSKSDVMSRPQPHHLLTPSYQPCCYRLRSSLWAYGFVYILTAWCYWPN